MGWCNISLELSCCHCLISSWWDVDSVLCLLGATDGIGAILVEDVSDSTSHDPMAFDFD